VSACKNFLAVSFACLFLDYIPHLVILMIFSFVNWVRGIFLIRVSRRQITRPVLGRTGPPMSWWGAWLSFACPNYIFIWQDIWSWWATFMGELNLVVQGYIFALFLYLLYIYIYIRWKLTGDLAFSCCTGFASFCNGGEMW
jgi:hypothetical protein